MRALFIPDDSRHCAPSRHGRGFPPHAPYRIAPRLRDFYTRANTFDQDLTR
jgi:hypothetical protein